MLCCYLGVNDRGNCEMPGGNSLRRKYPGSLGKIFQGDFSEECPGERVGLVCRSPIPHAVIWATDTQTDINTVSKSRRCNGGYEVTSVKLRLMLTAGR